MKIAEARPKIVERLKEKGLLEKIDSDYKHVVRTCYKCGSIIEPQIRSQWFIKMKSLAQEALRKIQSMEVEFIPQHYEKISIHWLENIIDWNISRQIVWGIPIPAKICSLCGEGFVDLEDKITKCEKCGGNVEKDNDTFDTWFSSGQWPFASLGYPSGADFKEFYPTQVLETAGDIIFFWVTRMIMLGLYVTGKVPFKTVYLHGMVLDAKAQKMSKSKGNVINPLDLTAKFGTDALRMALIVGNTPGTSLALSEDKIKAYKHFANKIWNATRFVLSNTENFIYESNPTIVKRDDEILRAMSETLTDITSDMENCRFYLAGEKLYHYFWHTFADIIIEESKAVLSGGNEQEIKSRKWTLIEIEINMLKALHPFMPFITEEIWSFMPHQAKSKMLIAERWFENKKV